MIPNSEAGPHSFILFGNDQAFECVGLATIVWNSLQQHPAVAVQLYPCQCDSTRPSRLHEAAEEVLQDFTMYPSSVHFVPTRFLPQRFYPFLGEVIHRKPTFE